MGSYVYRITGKQVRLSDGSLAEVAKYAYKPHYDERLNRKWARQTGVEAARKIAETREIADRVAIANSDGTIGAVYGNPHRWTSFLDDPNWGTTRMPYFPDLTVVE